MSEDLHGHLIRRPLHEQVAEILRTKVLSHAKPGQRIEAESKLAKRIGVSVLTLRQALSVVAHQGLVERRHGKGTFVADTRTKRHVAILNLMSEEVPDSSFQVRVVQLLGSIFQQRGYRHRFYVWMQTAGDVVCPDFVEAASRDQISGAVFVAMHAEPAMPILRKKRIPFLMTTDSDPPGVAIDFAQMVRDGTRYLLDRGCRRIAFMQWNYGLSQRTGSVFASLLAERGLKPDPCWMRDSVPPHVPGAGWEQFREIWTASDEKPDGLLVTDDVLFRDVAMGILDSGVRVPDQLQVVTHTNKNSGITYPFPVAALEIDPREYAEELATLLIQLMNKEARGLETRYVRARLIPAGKESARQAGSSKTVLRIEPQVR